MDKITAINIAKKYTELVRSKYDLSRAILFGSGAKGTAGDDSDIDIAIVLRKTDDILGMQFELMKLRRQVDLRIEPHPFDESDFSGLNPLVNEILKYGVEIH
jgi:predicted nucleotidyltransferase